MRFLTLLCAVALMMGCGSGGDFSGTRMSSSVAGSSAVTKSDASMPSSSAMAGAGDDDMFGNATGERPVLRDAGMRPVQDAAQSCDHSLTLVLRDFTEDHPDFEHFLGENGWDGFSDLDGIVEMDLGADHKPVYAPAGATDTTSGPAGFADWYRDVDGVNQRFEVPIEFEEIRPGVFAYDSSEFFPLDGKGFGSGPGGESHNFLFTTEAHTLFTYKGGEVFTFRGDDDLWVFVNNKLAVDLGGVHRELEESVDFDADKGKLGIEVGKTYPMDIFHAERHTSASNFHIETTIDLTCIQNVTVM